MDAELILGLVFLALWGGHWTPWAVLNLTDDTGHLHRLLAYGYGCGVIFVGFVLWALAQAQEMPIISIWSAVDFLARDMVAAGLGTVLPRVLRWIHEYRTLQEDVTEYEQAVQS